jgi:hypothetical protein
MYLLAVHKDFTVSLHGPEQGSRAAKSEVLRTVTAINQGTSLHCLHNSDRTSVHSAAKGWGNFECNCHTIPLVKLLPVAE